MSPEEETQAWADLYRLFAEIEQSLEATGDNRDNEFVDEGE